MATAVCVTPDSKPRGGGNDGTEHATGLVLEETPLLDAQDGAAADQYQSSAATAAVAGAHHLSALAESSLRIVTADLVDRMQRAARALDPPLVSHEVRGVWPPLDADAWRYAVRFKTAEHMRHFMARNCATPSNPERPHFKHAVTLWTTPGQLRRHVLPTLTDLGPPWRGAADLVPILLRAISDRQGYGPSHARRLLPMVEDEAAADARKPRPQRQRSTPHAGTDGNAPRAQRTREVPLPHNLVPAHVESRLRLAPYAQLHIGAPGAAVTLRYLMHTVRSGMHCAVRRNALCASVLYAHEAYRNTWGHALTPRLPGGSVDGVKRAFAAAGKHVSAQRCPSTWRAAGRVVYHGTVPAVGNDCFVQHVKDMLQTACATYGVQDVDVGVNRANAPCVPRHGGGLWPWLGRAAWTPSRLPVARAGPADPRPPMAPVLSFCTDAEHADVPIPTPLDWELATQSVFIPSRATDAVDPALFMARAAGTPWAGRIGTALFRGAATGAGVSPRDNQRMALCALQHAALDARITDTTPPRLVVQRDGRVCVAPVPHTPHAEHDGGPGDADTDAVHGGGARPATFVPMHEQVRHKYLIYMAGHAASWRFAAILLSGAVPILVDAPDTCVGNQLWAMPYFDGPYITRRKTWVPPTATVLRVRANLSNLGATLDWLRAYDGAARGIATQARAHALRVYSADNMAYYVASVLNTVSDAQRRNAPWMPADWRRQYGVEDVDGGWAGEWDLGLSTCEHTCPSMPSV